MVQIFFLVVFPITTELFKDKTVLQWLCKDFVIFKVILKPVAA